MDITTLPPDLLEKVKKWESQTYPAQQLKTLQDLREELGNLSSLLSSASQDDRKSDETVATTLQSIAEALDGIRNQEVAEVPDFAQPVIKALAKLQDTLATAIKGIEVTQPAPVVNVDAPKVQVDAPVIDLTGIQKVLKNDLPKAFNQAIAQIPPTLPTDMTPVLEALAELQPLLEEINTGVRLKPLPPSTIKVTNLDGSLVGIEPPLTARYDVEGTTIYVGEAPLGSTESADVWTITKFNLADMTAASAKVATNAPWSGRAVGSYV